MNKFMANVFTDVELLTENNFNMLLRYPASTSSWLPPPSPPSREDVVIDASNKIKSGGLKFNSVTDGERMSVAVVAMIRTHDIC